MQIKTTFRVLGVFLMLFSLTMLPPLIFSVWYREWIIWPYINSFVCTFLTGAILWSIFRKAKKDLKTRDGFLIVSLLWIVISVFGGLPFMFADIPHLGLTDAVFETVSGLTTTGSTVISGIDNFPHAIVYYRQQLQFIGGMGIIVLAVAILPMLGVGGMQLYRAETPGPVKDSKLTPRITETAKMLWLIYVGLTAFCALAYWASGLSLFEALGESFATVSTGGFAMHDASFAYYNNPLAEIIASIFMLLGGINFALHFVSVHRVTLKHYWNDPECRTYLLLLIFASLVPIIILTFNSFYPNVVRSIPQIIFNIISMSTTTGYVATPFSNWPTFLPFFVMFIAMIGGCGGSTSGGIKVLRILLLHKQAFKELNRLIHPNSVVALKFGNEVLPPHVLEAMWAFISVFLGIFIVLLLGLMATGMDITSAFGSLAASIANAGQGLGVTASSFGGINLPSKWMLIFAMLAGRLEIFTLLILFTPAFWRD